jgi:peptide/nickel transport system substrate-binding protein
MQLRTPNAAFLPTDIAYIPGFIVSQKAVQQYGDPFARNPIGTGPYAFDRLTTGREVVVAANDQYFRGRPQARQITFAPIADEIVAAEALIKGEFQVIWTRGNAEAVTLLEQTKGITTKREIIYDSLRQVAFSQQFKPAQDVRVRQALSYAINRQQISAALPGWRSQPTSCERTSCSGAA